MGTDETMTAPSERGEARELVSPLPDGSMSDVTLHAAILDNPAAERVSLLQTRERMMAQGMTAGEVDALYPIPD
jgi:hypothetical protein